MPYTHLLDRHTLFRTIQKVADERQSPTYVVGGFVRDLLLKRDAKDIDIVCVGSGIELAVAVAQALGIKEEKIQIFKRYGTAMFLWKEYEIEFVGARKESYTADSRNPAVENGTLDDDQQRRDFTINALAIGLNHDNYGKLIDPFDGVKDLENRIIRTPTDPYITFSDDPLRMMRAIRFATQLNFTILPATLEAIQKTKDRIEIISKERIIDELNKIVQSPTPSYGFKFLFDTGLLHLIFPEMVALYGVETINGQSHKDNFYHTLQVLDNIAKESSNLWLRWAAIMHDIAKPKTKRFYPKIGFTFHNHEFIGAKMVPRIFRKMRLPLNAKMNYVQKLVKLHLRPIALVKDIVTDSAVRRLVYEAGDDLEDLMLLARADITSKNHDRVQRYLNNFDIVEAKIKAVEEKDAIRNFQPVITGEIIMKTFDLKPSRVIGEIKEAIKEAMLDGKIRNQYEEAYAYMVALGKEKGLKPPQ